MTYPSIHAIWARWAPPLERSRLAAVAFSGSYVGTVIALPLSGLLAENCGWEWIFYVFGTIGLIWCAAWAWVVRDSPEEDKNITDRLIYNSRSFGYLANNISNPICFGWYLNDFYLCNIVNWNTFGQQLVYRMRRAQWPHLGRQ